MLRCLGLNFATTLALAMLLDKEADVLVTASQVVIACERLLVGLPLVPVMSKPPLAIGVAHQRAQSQSGYSARITSRSADECFKIPVAIVSVFSLA